MRTESQNTMILRYLRERGTITQAEAYSYFACSRLASRICDLRKKGLSLRVRFKDKKFEMTVKVPRVEGHIEKNVYITEDEFEGINGQTSFPENEIKKYIEEEGIDTSALYIKTVLTTKRIDAEYEGGELAIDLNTYSGITDYEATRRIDAEYEGGELAIDLNTYSGITDYEVELEHKDMATAEMYLRKLFEENNIPLKFNKKSKIRRALEAIGE